jgi:hypothetical protein
MQSFSKSKCLVLFKNWPMLLMFLYRTEFFTFEKSSMSLMLHELGNVVNVVFKKLIFWPLRIKLHIMMIDF